MEIIYTLGVLVIYQPERKEILLLYNYCELWVRIAILAINRYMYFYCSGGKSSAAMAISTSY